MQVGACIVNPESKKIVGIGHNGLPESRGWDQEDFPHWDTVPPEDIDDSEYRFENTKYAHGKSIMYSYRSYLIF